MTSEVKYDQGTQNYFSKCLTLITIHLNIWKSFRIKTNSHSHGVISEFDLM